MFNANFAAIIYNVFYVPMVNQTSNQKPEISKKHKKCIIIPFGQAYGGL